MKHGKKYKKSLEKIKANETYEAQEAFELLTSNSTAKFDETVELHVRLGVDSRHADQQVRGSVVLPNGTGKNVRVLVFADDEGQKAAKNAGADCYGGEELAEKIQRENFLDFDVVVAAPNMMRVVGKLGKILGPKGLMPSPKAGTVSANVAKAVEEVKTGRVEYRLDKNDIIHCVLGKTSFSAEKLLENFETLMNAISKARPEAFKGQYIKSCYVARTMSPSVKINATRYGG